MTITGKIILGLDIGATNTRILIADSEGRFIGYYQSEDKRNPDNTHKTVRNALEKYGFSLDDVSALGAGIAGFPYKEGVVDDISREYGYSLVNIKGLECNKYLEHDAVIVYKGALRKKKGLVVIVGSGSVIYDGKTAPVVLGVGAKQIATMLICNIIKHSSCTDNINANYLKRVLGYFDPYLSSIAPILTANAYVESSLEHSTCNQVVKVIINAIEQYERTTDSGALEIALVGSVVNSAYINSLIKSSLNPNKFHIIDDVHPEICAIIIALIGSDCRIDEGIVNETSRRLSVEKNNNN